MDSVRGHGEGTIYRRKDGRWVASVTLPTGYRRSRYAKTRAVAKAVLEEMLQGGTEKRTLGDFLAGWLREAHGTIRPATWRQYEMIARVHLTPALGRVPLRSLTPELVSDYLTRKRRTLSAQSVRHHRAVLRRALHVAQARGLVTRNAASLSSAPRMPRQKALQALTAAQVGILVDGTRDDRLWALYVVAATAGLRQAELLGLAWDDVDLDRGLLHIRSTLHRVDGEWVLAEPKTGSGERTVPLSEIAVEALTDHRRRMAGERTPEWKYHGLVFVTPSGNPIHGPNLLPPFYDHLEQLGLPRIPWHGLRHSAASVMLEAGVPIEVVSRVLGHSTIRVTMDVYGHLTEKVLRQASEGVNRALSGRSAVSSAVSPSLAEVSDGRE